MTACSSRGSSPLSRGIRSPWVSFSFHSGIIPALAGNTHLSRKDHHRTGDHPRSRGEYTPYQDMCVHYTGSSPLSRGIRANAAVVARATRIIPALAGNTAYRKTDEGSVRDHPRSRGEYPPGCASANADGGSSPLSRGIRNPRVPVLRRRRIIPALAGNTLTNSSGP